MSAAADACPCGLGTYAQCCEPRHSGQKPPETAEALMRARYSAFAKGEGAFLSSTGSGESPESLKHWAASVTWLGLSVLEREQGGAADAQGTVRFIARYLEAGKLVALEELSRFGRREGKWHYLAGDPVVTARAVERNESCPCGSGLKFKRCHAA